MRQQVPQPEQDLLPLQGGDLHRLIDRKLRHGEDGVEEPRLAHVVPQLDFERLVGDTEGRGEGRVRGLPQAQEIEKAHVLRAALGLVPGEVVDQGP